MKDKQKVKNFKDTSENKENCITKTESFKSMGTTTPVWMLTSVLTDGFLHQHEETKGKESPYMSGTFKSFFKG